MAYHRYKRIDWFIVGITGFLLVMALILSGLAYDTWLGYKAQPTVIACRAAGFGAMRRTLTVDVTCVPRESWGTERVLVQPVMPR